MVRVAQLTCTATPFGAQIFISKLLSKSAAAAPGENCAYRNLLWRRETESIAEREQTEFRSVGLCCAQFKCFLHNLITAESGATLVMKLGPDTVFVCGLTALSGRVQGRRGDQRARSMDTCAPPSPVRRGVARPNQLSGAGVIDP